MICLRCGYCCKNYIVGIVDDLEKGPVSENLTVNKGDGTPCKHLTGDKPGNYSCLAHNYSWYKETPCFSHGQQEFSKNTPCRMGEFILGEFRKQNQVKLCI